MIAILDVMRDETAWENFSAWSYGTCGVRFGSLTLLPPDTSSDTGDFVLTEETSYVCPEAASGHLALAGRRFRLGSGFLRSGLHADDLAQRSSQNFALCGQPEGI